MVIQIDAATLRMLGLVTSKHACKNLRMFLIKEKFSRKRPVSPDQRGNCLTPPFGYKITQVSKPKLSQCNTCQQLSEVKATYCHSPFKMAHTDHSQVLQE